MRAIFLPTIGAVLSLGASGVFANVICDTKPYSRSTDAGLLAEVTTQCIENACASGRNENRVTESCGSALLTITHLSAPPSDVGDCISQFQSIIDECITTEGVNRGVSETQKVIYDISTVDESESQEPGGPLERRTLKRRKPTKTTVKNTAVKTPKPPPKDTPEDPPKSTLRTKPKTTLKPTPKPTLKTTSKAATRTVSKASSSTEPSSCPLPTGNGTKEKTVRDIAESFLPKVLRRALLPRGCVGSTHLSEESFYKRTVLQQNRVTWYMFNRRRGQYMDSVEPANIEALAMLAAMENHGKFDVIRITNARLSIEGNQQGGGMPGEFTAQGGRYLLSNGGFFDMHANNPAHRYFSVGQTSSTPHFVPIMPRYRPYYDRLAGNNGHFLWSGPSLRNGNIPSTQAFVYNDNTNEGPGSLRHALQNNERLAIATVGNDRYLFVYTARRRDDGVTVNALRTLIDTFLQQFVPTTGGIAGTTQVLNLDGGGSIYVSWNNENEETVIAQGSIQDESPTGATNPRRVTNFVKISAP